LLGPVREVRDSELAHWADGPPVEVLEGASGPAFVIVGGRRLPLRGLPLPYPVTADEMLRFPEGEELRIGVSAGGPATSSGRSKQLIAVFSREGIVKGGFTAASKGGRRLARKLRGSPK